jgi:hypothetical protein
VEKSGKAFYFPLMICGKQIININQNSGCWPQLFSATGQIAQE